MPACHALLIGDGPRREFLEILAQNLEIRASVHFLGNRSDVSKLLAVTDVVALSSYTVECFPYAILEVGVSEARVFTAVADARVEATSPAENFGSSSVLKVDGSPQYASFLRFDVSGLSGTVLSAKLRLYATDATVNGPAVYTTNSTWQESTVTYQSQPATQTHLSSSSAVAANAWVEWDVTAAVQGNGAVNLALAPTGTDGTVFYSRNTSTTSMRPQLVVTVDSGTPPPPPPSSGDWTFYGAAQGGPRYVYGVSADAGGNIWVAGGEEGLFVLQQGQTHVPAASPWPMACRPYGYMPTAALPRA